MNDTTRRLGRAVAALMFTLLAACGSDPAVEMANERAALMNEMADILASVTDEASLDAAREDMTALGEKISASLETWEDKVAEFESNTPERMAELAEKTSEATQRVTKEMMRLAMDPKLGPQVAELMDALGEALGR